MVLTTIMNIPLTLALLQLPATDARGALQLAQYYAQHIDKIGTVPLIIAGVGLLLSFAVRIVSAIYGDYIYKQRVVLSVSLIKNAEDKDMAKRKYSGTSFIGFFLSVLALEFAPSVISLFL